MSTRIVDATNTAERTSPSGHPHVLWSRIASNTEWTVVSCQQHIMATATGWDSLTPTWYSLYMDVATAGYVSTGVEADAVTLGVSVSTNPVNEAEASTLARYFRAQGITGDPEQTSEFIRDLIGDMRTARVGNEGARVAPFDTTLVIPSGPHIPSYGIHAQGVRLISEAEAAAGFCTTNQYSYPLVI